MDDCCGVCCISISCVGASTFDTTYTTCPFVLTLVTFPTHTQLSSPRPSATSLSKRCPAPPTPHSRPTASASTPLRHRCAHFDSIALAFSLPVLAATLAFVTYTETSEQFDVVVVFASFSLFQLLRQLMMFVPRTLSACLHAPLARFLRAASRGRAVCGRSGAGGGGVGEGDGVKAKVKKEKEGGEKQNEEEHAHEPDEPPFALHDITLSIPRGRSPPFSGAWGAAGRVCCRASLGDALHRHQGQVGVWRRDNVLFGQPFEADRHWCVIEDSYLRPDLQLLADGDLTEMCVGEKGSIYRASGQRQRVNIARALYYGADVVIFDDPLSAGILQSHHLIYIIKSLIGLVVQGKTVLLVTHALHFLAQCDYIYTLDGGHIAEAGTYPELIARGGEFARLDREFGGPKAEDAGRESGAGEHGDGDEAQVQVVSVEDALILCVPLGWSY
ncbi:P-loop containing nucleoside triphosphate hydrolase protein [Mycena leptocephala]|nr:P-loop containing nucleoside triphosphate hydrolase protein [Mycena leptocephala]